MSTSPRFIAVLAFALTFAAGAGTARVYDERSSATAAHESMGTWADAERVLGLSAEQREAIQGTFAKYQPSTDALITSLIPSLKAVSDSMQREIEAVLDAGQRERLRAMQRPPVYLIKRKTLEGSRVDTVSGGKSR